MARVARLAALCTVVSALVVTAAAGAAASPGPAAPGGHPPGHRPAAPAAVTGHAAATTAGQQAGVRRYWTPARMRHAAPVTAPQRAPLTAAPSAQLRAPGAPGFSAATAGLAWVGGGEVARTTGKVFFTMSGHDFVCSGSTVASRNMDVVVTAGHCAKDGTGAWAANWTFVPGYADGHAPYGTYTARRFFVASPWSSQADNDYDVAFVTVNPARVQGIRVAVAAEVGGQGIAFGRQPAQETAFGYPADAPYTGQRLYYCGGSTSPDPYQLTTDTGLRCALTAGTSGGPWLSGFNPATGTGTITSVSSFKYSTDGQTLYGPVLGGSARALYEAAQGLAAQRQKADGHAAQPARPQNARPQNTQPQNTQP